MVIRHYYQDLKKKEKKRFRLAVMTVTEVCEATLMQKMRTDRFSKLEREAIEKIIHDFKKDEES